MSRRVALIGLIAGVVLAIGPAALWLLGGTSVADVPPGASGSPSPGSPTSETADGRDGGLALTTAPPQVAPAALQDPAPELLPSAGAPSTDPTVPPFVAGAAAPEPPPPAPPVRIRVPDVGVDAPVVDSGVDDRGGMAVPHDIRTVGWYRFGVGPGAPAGSAVLAGHVDDKIQGHGAFYRLADLALGSPVEVVLADGRVVTYRVSAVEQVAKTALPADQVFARNGPPRLSLVTCGGTFDRASGGYRDNVVVTAQ